MTSCIKLDSPGSYYFYISLTLVYFMYTLLAVSADSVAPYDPSVDIRSQAMLGFCDGEFYVPKSKTTCAAGINFGDRPPKCVCIKGAYQMYWDNCEVAVGFAEEVCTLLNDTVSRSKTKGIKLTKEIEWDKVGLVCNRMVGSGTEWDYVGSNGKAKIGSGTLNFYTINGKAFTSVTTKGKIKTVQICVQQETREKIICNYRHVDNLEDWTINKITEIIVRDVCPEANYWIPLEEKQCFEPLTIFNSDCQVPCRKSNFFIKGSSGLGQIELNGTANLEGDCTDPKGFFNHENHFMDRNLLMYMVLDQIRGPDDKRNITLVEPKTDGLKRTYILYDLVKQIALKACEHPYLKSDTLEWAAKFFMYLQKATKLQYEIKISDEDFKWIEVILKKCSARAVTMKLSTKDHNAMCPSGQKEATGYCRPAAIVAPSKSAHNDTTDADGNTPTEETVVTELPPTECDYNEVKISQLYSNYKQKHYVPEYNWLFLDIVHMLCFLDFKESYRMFHILEQVYEQLFTTPIRDYWHFPRWSTSTKTSMFTVEADTVMWNMQICAQSIYNYNQNILHRTMRPSRSKYPMRKKRAAEVLSTSSDVSCAKTKSDFKLPKGCTGTPPKSKSP